MCSDNTPNITVDEFVIAIVTTCPHTSSFKDYISELVSSSSKGRKDKWSNFCNTIRGSDEPANRHWRDSAKKKFIKNIIEIERDLYQRLSFLNDPNNAEAIDTFLSSQLNKQKYSESVIRCTREYLRLRSNGGVLDISSDFDCDDNNNTADDGLETEDASDTPTGIETKDVSDTPTGIETKDLSDTQTGIASEDIPDIQTGTVSEDVPEDNPSLSSEDAAVAEVSEECPTEIEDQHPPKKAYQSKNKFFVVDPSYLNEREIKEVVSTAFQMAKEATKDKTIVQAVVSQLKTSDNQSFSLVKRDPRTPDGTPYSSSSSATISADESSRILNITSEYAASTSGKSSLDPTKPPIKPPAKPPTPPTGPPAGPRGSRRSSCESTSSSSSYSSSNRVTLKPPKTPTKSSAKPPRSPNKSLKSPNKSSIGAKGPHRSSSDSSPQRLTPNPPKTPTKSPAKPPRSPNKSLKSPNKPSIGAKEPRRSSSDSSPERLTPNPPKTPTKSPAKPPRSPNKLSTRAKEPHCSTCESTSGSSSHSSSEPFTRDPTRPPIKPPGQTPRSPGKPPKGPRRRRSSSSESRSSPPSNSSSESFLPTIPRGPNTSSPQRRSRSPGDRRRALKAGDSPKQATELVETTPNELSRPGSPPPARPPVRPPIRPPNKPPNRPPGNRRDSDAGEDATSTPGDERGTSETGNSAEQATELFETTPNELSRPGSPPPARPPVRPPIRPPNKPPNRPPGNRRDSDAGEDATS
ncbi:nascent polypeptide-associated complex subunit alpha, muscle-specific form-like [Microplitis mediator]|uniref:nascent polypeptide-associated complex subunit alpha, muscle-specific form-like n=1 Tax=Microplitis mediator TaxID=375433 RepID=UPI002556D182|nr:nascent polypeptide-associated complex subunit alpha, muscle-specific form-like [Microplitis mediator]